jgi:hypothetical protein
VALRLLGEQGFDLGHARLLRGAAAARRARWRRYLRERAACLDIMKYAGYAGCSPYTGVS